MLKLKKQQIPETNDFKNWKKTNVKPQKQKGLYSVAIRVNNGNFTSRVARKLAALIRNYASNELRFTLRQNMLLRHVPEEAIPFFYQALFELGLAQPGADSIHSITSCPGTDTCNLGIASSTGITRVLEHLLAEEYPTLIHQNNLSIKISGCMNSCGQHMMAGIGFQGMSMKIGDRVAPALQVLLGGENQGNGQGKFAEKVIKIPSKRGPDALRRLLNDFISQGENRAFARYYETQGKNYFFELLKPLSDIDTLTSNDFVDWGHETPYKTSIGIGECAGVTVDLVATLLLESEEKRAHAQHALQEEKWADAIYWSYAIYVNSAKALLLTQNKKTNSQAQIISAFSEWAEEIAPGVFKDFAQELYQIKNNAPSQTFAHNYARQAWNFHKKIITHRKKEHNEK